METEVSSGETNRSRGDSARPRGGLVVGAGGGTYLPAP